MYDTDMSVLRRTKATRGRAPRMRGDDRRAQLLRVAVSIFARLGYERASVADVCNAVRIGRGTFYEYFTGKHELFRAILTEYGRRLGAHMRPVQEMGVPLPSSPEEGRRFLADRFRLAFEMMHEERDIFRILLTEAMAKNAETADLFLAIQRSLVDTVARELRYLMEKGLVRRGNPEHLATFFLGGLAHVALSYVIGESGKIEDLDRLADEMADLVLAGL